MPRLLRPMPHLLLGLLLVFSSTLPANASCLDPAGDVNASGATDVGDVQCAILLALWELGGSLGASPGCDRTRKSGATKKSG